MTESSFSPVFRIRNTDKRQLTSAEAFICIGVRLPALMSFGGRLSRDCWCRSGSLAASRTCRSRSAALSTRQFSPG